MGAATAKQPPRARAELISGHGGDRNSTVRLVVVDRRPARIEVPNTDTTRPITATPVASAAPTFLIAGHQPRRRRDSRRRTAKTVGTKRAPAYLLRTASTTRGPTANAHQTRDAPAARTDAYVASASDPTHIASKVARCPMNRTGPERANAAAAGAANVGANRRLVTPYTQSVATTMHIRLSPRAPARPSIPST